MISRLADIYPIVTPDPTDTFILQREEAIKALATDEAIGAHLPEWIELVHLGVPTESAQKVPPGVTAIIKTIQEQQPSFPNDPVEKALDLRVTAAAILDHYLSDAPEDEALFSRVAAALILSASRLRISWPEPRFASLVYELRKSAQAVLDKQAIVIRARGNLAFPAVGGTDISTLAASVNASLKALRDVTGANIRADREELQILWWTFGRNSTTLKAPYANLSPGDAAIAAATELAGLMLLPPTPAASDFLRTVLGGQPALSLSKLVGQVPLSTLRLLVPDNERCQEIARRQPGLLPMTWLAVRLVESDRSPWETEFEKKTQLSPSTERSTSDWAEQVFAEHTSRRLVETDWPAEKA
jgi:hypothetical protein